LFDRFSCSDWLLLAAKTNVSLQGNMNIFLDSDFADDSAEENQSLPGQTKRRGGRPPQIDEGRLLNNRDRFIEILSFAWGEIGWKLIVARTASDLRAAFSQLKVHGHEYLLNPFVRPTTVEAKRTGSLRLEGGVLLACSYNTPRAP
jgi:hypothetical protein